MSLVYAVFEVNTVTSLHFIDGQRVNMTEITSACTCSTFDKVEPVNTVTNGPKNLAILTRVSFTRKCMAVLPGDQKSGYNNEMTV